MTMVKAFIDGQAGTTGLGIRQRLLQHPAVELLEIDPLLRKDDAARKAMFQAADIAFLCLPDQAAREAAILAADCRVRLLDASTAHRTAPGWAYGFPELAPAMRAAIATGNRIAVPGCHASGMIALAYPLIQAGILPLDAPLSFVSITGYTGGGNQMIAQYEAPGPSPQLDAPRQYALGQTHKHLPEVCALSGLITPPAFLPVVGDFPRGMLVTLPLHKPFFTKAVTPGDVREIYAAHYGESPVVQVLPMGAEAAEAGFLTANAKAGKDNMELLVTGNDERLLVHARFDNLGKGASGAALQCMNIMLGLDETEGLNL